MSMSYNNRRAVFKDKVAGAMYGFAIGDAMGATTEFMTRRQVAVTHGEVHDIIGGGWLHLKPGHVTDDTEMMLCVAEAYEASTACGIPFDKEVAKRFISWYNNDPVDIGNACRQGILRLKESWPAVRSEVNEQALGNGALMRALPLAIVDNFDANWAQAKMTHNNDAQRHYVEQYHKMVAYFLYGPRYGEPIGWQPYKDEDERDFVQPSGHVADTLYHVVWWNMTRHSFRDVIVGAVNNGGDADTIAALTGGLAGAKYGWQNIPKEWVEQLDSGVKGRLDKSIDFLVSCCLGRHYDV